MFYIFISCVESEYDYIEDDYIYTDGVYDDYYEDYYANNYAGKTNSSFNLKYSFNNW